MDANLKVADTELREIVQNLRKNGLPEEKPISEVRDDFSEKQNKILSSVAEVAEKEKSFKKRPEECIQGDNLWSLRKKIRGKLQDAIKAGLLHLGIIQRQAITYGAIPDPNEGWKYYRLPNLNYACWNCGDEILVKTQRVSIHDGPFPLSGSGRVKNKYIPYCPSCNKEPSDSSIEKVDSSLT